MKILRIKKTSQGDLVINLYKAPKKIFANERNDSKGGGDMSLRTDKHLWIFAEKNLIYFFPRKLN